MVKVASCFAQALSMVNRNLFERAVRRHGAERGAKGFSCWDQFVAMLFCQLGAAHSLREICGGLATAMGKLVHLCLGKAPGRSTLAYANANRPWQLYVEVRPVPAGSNILGDTVIRLASGQGQRECPSLLRRIVVWDAENARSIKLLTNHLDFAASALAAMLRFNLLTHRDLRAWLDAPYQTPVIEPEPRQLALFPV